LPIVDFVLLIAFVLDLLASWFVWQGFLPEAVTSLSQILVAGAVIFAYTRMMILGRIPVAVWALLGVSALGITVAIFSGQSIVPTLWGWWNLFKYPLLGIYAYVRLQWPDGFSQLLIRICLGLVVFEAAFQMLQYLSGVGIGDNLAGSFGWHGVVHIFFLTTVVLGLALGLWVAEGRWGPLLLALVLGVVANVLAENKIFPVAALAMATVAVVLYVLRRGDTWRLLLFAVLSFAGVWLFSVGYNNLVPGADREPLQRLFLEEDARANYLNKVKRSSNTEQLSFSLGRNNAVEYALNSLRGDPTSLAFGFGLGARSQSQALGVTGVALRQDAFRQGSQLVVILQEMGLFGLLLIAGFTIWVSVTLWKDIRRYPGSPALWLRYGLLFFSLFWPVWLWYKNPLGADVAMMIYWISLGYALSEPHLDELGAQSLASPSAEEQATA
jgi:hypothetical protein